MKSFAFLSALAFTLTISAMAETELQTIPLKDIHGKDTSLKAFEGKVVLVVNVASKCGLTPQYEALEAIQRKYKDQGFTVVAFPCNDFANQEPGTNKQIIEFCESTYDVTFPLMDKVHVKGADQHPLYAQLTGETSKFPGEVSWNFGKFLLNGKGELIARFEPRTTPDDEKVVAAIEAALAAK